MLRGGATVDEDMSWQKGYPFYYIKAQTLASLNVDSHVTVKHGVAELTKKTVPMNVLYVMIN